METQKFEITGPGEYRTRAGEKAVVECIDGTDLAIEGFPITGRVDGGFKSWSVAGRYFHAGESPLDIVGPWVEPKAEPESFKITGPGEYRTRDGQKVVVTRVTPDVDGDAYPVVGKVEGETDPDAWAARGGIYGDDCVTKYERDIVGPWVEEGTVVDAEFEPEVNGKQRGPAFAVGQTWKDREGRPYAVTIVYPNGIFDAREVGRLEWAYTKDGECVGNYRERDLVEFVSHPESMTAKDFEVEIAKPEPIAEPVRLSDMQWNAEERAEIAAAVPLEFNTIKPSDEPFEDAEPFDKTALAADMQEFDKRFVGPTVEQMAADELAAFEDDRDEALETMAAALRVLVRALDRHGYAPGSEVADAHRFASLTLEGFEP